MKIRPLAPIAALASLLVASAAAALDPAPPAPHTRPAQKPGCASMQKIDMRKTDANDPAMKAIDEQCAGADGNGHAHDMHRMNHSTMPPAGRPDAQDGH